MREAKAARRSSFVVRFVGLCCVALGAAVASPAQEAGKQPPTPEEQAMMAAWQKALTPGEQHALLASMAGEWTYAAKMWMNPAAPPSESTGTATQTVQLGGRYLEGKHMGNFMGMPFEGIGYTAYDNVTGQYMSTWIDNMATGIMTMNGKYDAATKTLTFRGNMPDVVAPKQNIPVRETLKIVGPDQHVMEMFETRGGKETKTMQIVYSRKK